MSYATGYGDYGLDSISPEGVVPSTRMRSAAQVVDFGRRLWQNDEKRSKKRAQLNGLVGGFPPYRQSSMRTAGLAQNCNANFNTSSAYMENGSGAFYDLFSEAPGVVNVKTEHGTEEQRDEWSRIISEEADRIFHEDPLWDYEMQRSQWEMTLHGCGPMIWEDMNRVLPRAVSHGDFKVPERTRADVGYYEVVWADVDWYPPEAYAFIRDAETAKKAGYNVEYMKTRIANAMDIRQPEQRAYDWEFYEQELKNNSLSYYDDTKVVHVGYCWWKEFDGRVTQAIVERENTGGANKGNSDNAKQEDDVQYMFFHQGRYSCFEEAMAAMYMDRGNGGFHHSVNGMGQKMYSAMEFENRLLCRLMDGAFAPKVLFKPTSTEVTQKMQLAHMGNFGVVPAGWDVVESPISGFINEGLAMYRASSDLMRSNLSSYRQQPEPQKPGNPETKFGRQMDAYSQSALSKTTFNRYYKQLDRLYTEVLRRLCDLNNPDERSKRFKRRCQDRGVMRECFGRIASVEAVRVVGEGNAILRKTSLQEMMSVVPSLPEVGQNNWRNDYIAAICGQKSVMRYNPPKQQTKLQNDQTANAMLQVAAMKVGTPPIVTSSQNPVTFAGMFLTAAVQALQSVTKGANPAEVLKFLKLCGPAIFAHLKRFANDPLRKTVFQQMLKQFKQLSANADKLKKMVQDQQKKQAQLRQQQQQQLSDEAIKAQKVKGDLMLKKQKQDATLKLQAQKHRQNLAIADATAASNIERQNRIAAFSD